MGTRQMMISMHAVRKDRAPGSICVRKDRMFGRVRGGNRGGDDNAPGQAWSQTESSGAV